MALQFDLMPNSARQAIHAGMESLDLQAALSVVGALLLGLVIGGLVAVTAAEFGVAFVIPLMLIAPVSILLLRYPFAAVMLWLLVFPFVARATTELALPVYWAVHRLMIPGTLWLVLMGSWARGRKRGVVRLGPAEFVMGLSLLWALGSILLLGRPPVRIIGLYDRLFVPYCMYWLVRLIGPTAEDLRRLLPVAIFTLMTQAAIGLLSWFAPSSLPPQWLGEAGERVVGTFRNPAVYTSTILFVSLLIFHYGMHSKSTLARALSIFAISLGFLCVGMSFSRGSWLGGILVLIGLTIVYRDIMIRLIAAGVIFGVLLGTTVFSREIAFGYERLNDEATAESRILTGAKSLGMIEQRPWFGWGYGNYDLYDDQFRVHPANNPENLKESAPTSHNTYLTVMAEQGIPALALYLFPAGWWLLQSLAVWRRLPRRGFWSRSLLVLLWLLMLDHFTVSNFMDMIRFNLFGTTIWWMALGLIATLAVSHVPAAYRERGWLDPLLPSQAQRVELGGESPTW